MAQIAAAPQRHNLALWSLVLLGVGLLSILPLSLVNPSFDSGSSAGVATFDRTRIAYFEFGPNADTLWLADPSSPANRTKLFSVEHAPEYGVVPSLSPDSRSAAYLVLPPQTPAPGPDAPAQLWVTPLSEGEPTLLSDHADLLVPAVWSPDGSTLVFRRTDGLAHLYAIPAAAGPERLLISSPDGIFPVAFTGLGNRLLYASLGDQGSFLHELDVVNGNMVVIKLSGALTRDWTLSPDGTRLAYLEMTFSGQAVAARAFVLDLATGSRVAAGASGSDAFSPAWDAEGRLVIGQLATGATSTAASIVGEGPPSALAAPKRGFDVPLAVDAEAGAAVTSFDGASITNPGRASLVVVRPDGFRQEIASGEVTFLGWITP